jgi:hypothetical protein
MQVYQILFPEEEEIPDPCKFWRAHNQQLSRRYSLLHYATLVSLSWATYNNCF